MLLHSVSDTDTPPIQIRQALNMLASYGCRKVLDTEFRNSDRAVNEAMFSYQKFSKFSVISNFLTHIWSIKYNFKK